MTIQKLDEKVRLLEMDVADLKNKMSILFQTERLGSFGKVVLLDNTRWTIITALPVYKTFELQHWEQHTETEFEFEFPKMLWNKSEISTNKSAPSTLGTVYDGTVQMFLDSEGYVNIKISRPGNNVNTFISTIVT